MTLDGIAQVHTGSDHRAPLEVGS